jgi:hypothetical protein
MAYPHYLEIQSFISLPHHIAIMALHRGMITDMSVAPSICRGSVARLPQIGLIQPRRQGSGAGEGVQGEQ